MIRIFLKELFYTLTGSILIFTILEAIKPNLILAYFNLNYLLIFWIIIGIVLLLMPNVNKGVENDGQN